VDVGTLLPANPQPFELMQPRQTPLHHPPQPTKPRTMHDTAASDLWADAPRPQRPTVAVKVVAAVGDQHHRSLPRPAALPRTGGIASTSGSSWVTSWALPPVSETASGIPAASQTR
jgi:hypothetical protein